MEEIWLNLGPDIGTRCLSNVDLRERDHAFFEFKFILVFFLCVPTLASCDNLAFAKTKKLLFWVENIPSQKAFFVRKGTFPFEQVNHAFRRFLSCNISPGDIVLYSDQLWFFCGRSWSCFPPGGWIQCCDLWDYPSLLVFQLSPWQFFVNLQVPLIFLANSLICTLYFLQVVVCNTLLFCFSGAAPNYELEYFWVIHGDLADSLAFGQLQ